MNSEEAVQVLSVLMAAYPQVDIQEETISVYAQFLEDIPFQAGKAAALNIIGQSKWFPSVAELRKEAIEMVPGNRLPTAADAWGEVIDQIRRVGYIGAPQFTDPLIEDAVKTFGWRNLCLSENGMVDRAHFIKIYDTYRERKMKDNLQLPESKNLLAAAQQLALQESTHD